MTVLEKRVVKTVNDMQGYICKFIEGQFQQKNVKISQNAMYQRFTDSVKRLTYMHIDCISISIEGDYKQSTV